MASNKNSILIQLPASKSECNRALLISAISKGAVDFESSEIEKNNFETAEDVRVMNQLLESNDEILDVGDAGTVMRFLAAYFSFQNRDVMLTGSARMKERPIGLLVDALRELGADIHYADKEGFPPLAIYGRNAHFGESKISIPGDVSSQYISALLMIGPTLPDGIEIEIAGKFFSEPYVHMTLELLTRCGINHQWIENRIRIERQNFSFTKLKAAADWSAAAYFYFLLAQSSGLTEFFLGGLEDNSPQGDSLISKWMLKFGIKTIFESGGARIQKFESPFPGKIELDFAACPDLAQGMIVFLASKNISASFTGIESLRIKETDRITALDAELIKFGVSLIEIAKGEWKLEGRFVIPAQKISIKTWGDHRMAMAFSQTLLLSDNIGFENPEVVKKSFPGFWKEAGKISNFRF